MSAVPLSPTLDEALDLALLLARQEGLDYIATGNENASPMADRAYAALVAAIQAEVAAARQQERAELVDALFERIADLLEFKAHWDADEGLARAARVVRRELDRPLAVAKIYADHALGSAPAPTQEG